MRDCTGWYAGIVGLFFLHFCSGPCWEGGLERSFVFLLLFFGSRTGFWGGFRKFTGTWNGYLRVADFLGLDHHVEYVEFVTLSSLSFSVQDQHSLLNTSFLYHFICVSLFGSSQARRPLRIGSFSSFFLLITNVPILFISVSGSYRDTYSGAYPGPSYIGPLDQMFHEVGSLGCLRTIWRNYSELRRSVRRRDMARIG